MTLPPPLQPCFSPSSSLLITNTCYPTLPFHPNHITHSNHFSFLFISKIHWSSLFTPFLSLLLRFLFPIHNAQFHYVSRHIYILLPAPSLPFPPPFLLVLISSVCRPPPLSSLPEAMPVGGSGGLRGSVRGFGGFPSACTPSCSPTAAPCADHAAWAAVSAPISTTPTRLGTFTRMYMHAHRGRECDVCEVAQ